MASEREPVRRTLWLATTRQARVIILVKTRPWPEELVLLGSMSITSTPEPQVHHYLRSPEEVILATNCTALIAIVVFRAQPASQTQKPAEIMLFLVNNMAQRANNPRSVISSTVLNLDTVPTLLAPELEATGTGCTRTPQLIIQLTMQALREICWPDQKSGKDDWAGRTENGSDYMCYSY